LLEIARITLSFDNFISTGNQGGYNYPSGGGHYQDNNYQFGSNAIDSSYNNIGRNNYPSPTYGPAFH